MFQSEKYIGSESSGFVEVAVIISGGSSTTPISAMVGIHGQSEKGDEIYTKYHIVITMLFNRIR